MSINANPKYSFELLADYVDGLVDQQTADQIEETIAVDDETAAIVDGIRFYYEEKTTDRAGLESYLDGFSERLAKGITENPRYGEKSGASTETQLPITGKPSFFSPLRIAAAIALLIAAGFIFTQLGAGSTNPVLAQLEEVYPAPVNTRSGNDPAGSTGSTGAATAEVLKLKADASAFYSAADYGAAAVAFEQLALQQPVSDEWKFYVALSKLYDKQYAAAVESFDNLLSVYAQGNDWEGHYTQPAQWYRSLALYQTSGKSAAMEEWLKISQQDSHYKREAAAELLNQTGK